MQTKLDKELFKAAIVQIKLNDQLIKAATAGNLQLVQSLLKQGANIEAAGEIGRTPLHKAAWMGHAETVRFLIEKNANIDSKDRYGATPLLYAASNGCIEIIKFLIEKGANIEVVNLSKQAPLHAAIVSSRLDAVKLLVSYMTQEETFQEDIKRLREDFASRNIKLPKPIQDLFNSKTLDKEISDLRYLLKTARGLSAKESLECAKKGINRDEFALTIKKNKLNMTEDEVEDRIYSAALSLRNPSRVSSSWYNLAKGAFDNVIKSFSGHPSFTKLQDLKLGFNVPVTLKTSNQAIPAPNSFASIAPDSKKSIFFWVAETNGKKRKRIEYPEQDKKEEKQLRKNTLAFYVTSYFAAELLFVAAGILVSHFLGFGLGISLGIAFGAVVLPILAMPVVNKFYNMHYNNGKVLSSSNKEAAQVERNISFAFMYENKAPSTLERG